MPAAPSAVVLDAWPVLESYGGNEPSATEIDSLLGTSAIPAIMCMVTFSEVYSSMLRDRGPDAADRDAAWLRELLVLAPISPELAAVAARIKCAYHMSLGDSFAAATAIIHAAPLWTGDAELLCEDRIWETNDLRDAERRQQHADHIAARKLKVGRRANALPTLQRRQLDDYILSPLTPQAAAAAPSEQL